jgi:hypothetical protein
MGRIWSRIWSMRMSCSAAEGGCMSRWFVRVGHPVSPMGVHSRYRYNV